MKKRLFSLLTLSICVLRLNSQEAPPSLGLGVGKLVGTKGTIDVEVLASLIGDKQEEFKKEVIGRLLRDNLNNGSYAFYSFANQSISNLFGNKTKTATKKKLVENLTNLAIVYGFSEFYVRTSYDMMGNSNLRRVLELSPTKILDSDVKDWWLNRLVSRVPNTLSPTASVKLLSTMIKAGPQNNSQYQSIVGLAYGYIIPNLDSLKDDLNLLFENSNPIALQKQRNFFSLTNFMVNQLKPDKYHKENIPLNEILVDMTYDIMIRNKRLEKLGFFKVSREILDERYQNLNKYLFIMNSDNDPKILHHFGNNTGALNSYRDALKGLHNRIEEEIDLLVNNYQMIRELIKKEMSISELVYHYDARRKDIKSNTLFTNEVKSLIKKINDNISKADKDTLLPMTNNLIKFLKDLSNRTTDIFTDGDITYFKKYEYFTKTRLQAIGILTDGDDQQFDKIYAYVWHSRLYKLNALLENSDQKYLAKINLTAFVDYMELLANLGSLDKADTYDEVFRLVLNAGYLYDNYYNTLTFNQIVGTIEKYAKINREENTIDLDVEEIILTLYEKWSRQTTNKLSFYFTVGLNQSLGGDRRIYADSTTPVGFGFASEKIGVKYKWINCEKRRSQRFKDRDYLLRGDWGDDRMNARRRKREFRKNKTDIPLISNVNSCLYGSGLLYNITNSTTKKDFKSPMIGTSIGIQLFNGLEFNLFMNVPLYSQNSFDENFYHNKFYGLSFDIPIADYLNAVRKKRQEEKLKKQQESETNKLKTDSN